VKSLLLCGGIGNRFQPLRDNKFRSVARGFAADETKTGGSE
jgi:hypothetical protein